MRTPTLLPALLVVSPASVASAEELNVKEACEYFAQDIPVEIPVDNVSFTSVGALGSSATGNPAPQV